MKRVCILDSESLKSLVYLTAELKHIVRKADRPFSDIFDQM